MDANSPGQARRRTLLRAAVAGALAAPAAGCAYSDAPGTYERNARPVPAGEVPIHIVTGDWHADIAISTALVDPRLLDEIMPAPLPRDGHVALGFGSRDVFADFHPGAVAFLGSFINTPGAIAVSHVPPRIPDAPHFEAAVELHVTRRGFRDLLTTLRAEIESDGDGRAKRVGEQVYRRGRVLFESRRLYNTEYTCSTWVAEMLTHAGLPFVVEGAVWPRQVRRQAERMAVRQQRLRGLATG